MYTEISCYLRVYRASRGCLRGPVRGFIVITRRRGKQTGNGSGITIIAYRFAISRRGVSYRRAGGRVTSLR